MIQNTDRLRKLLIKSQLCINSRKLADFLIANGVILPPCKVGDTVYSKNGNPYVIEGIHYKNGRFLFGGNRDSAEGTPQKIWFDDEIGSKVFLTKALKENSCADESM